MTTIDRRLPGRAEGIERKVPKRSLSMAAAMLLGGCATGLSLNGGGGAVVGEGMVRLGWVEPHRVEVTYQGKRYAGPWAGEPCSAELCGEVYRKTPRLHQRHLRKGRAVLRAEDGARLECDWISHLPEVDGTCRTDDGRSFRLQGADGAERSD
jgi:hypothetical protein